GRLAAVLGAGVLRALRCGRRLRGVGRRGRAGRRGALREAVAPRPVLLRRLRREAVRPRAGTLR
ncbi:hypothetical protein AB8B12_33115, partial [Streptomyces sp. PGLac3x]